MNVMKKLNITTMNVMKKLNIVTMNVKWKMNIINNEHDETSLKIRKKMHYRNNLETFKNKSLKDWLRYAFTF